MKKIVGEKLKEQLINLQKVYKEKSLFFQITFYGETSYKVTIFNKDYKIIRKWYKNNLEKILKSLEESIIE